jgi:hypothetical protein
MQKIQSWYKLYAVLAIKQDRSGVRFNHVIGKAKD